MRLFFCLDGHPMWPLCAYGDHLDGHYSLPPSPHSSISRWCLLAFSISNEFSFLSARQAISLSLLCSTFGIKQCCFFWSFSKDFPFHIRWSSVLMFEYPGSTEFYFLMYACHFSRASCTWKPSKEDGIVFIFLMIPCSVMERRWNSVGGYLGRGSGACIMIAIYTFCLKWRYAYIGMGMKYGWEYLAS